MTFDQPPTTLEEALQIIRFLVRENQKLREENLQLREENRQLRERVESLEAKLNKNSKNSSKPPSSDQKGKSKVGKNCGGGKPGHKGHYRSKIPPEKVTKRVFCSPKYCDRCGSAKGCVQSYVQKARG